MPPIELLAAGMMTPVGLTAATTAAAVRAGIARVRETDLRDRHGEPLVMGLVDESRLSPPVSALVTLVAHARLHERLLRIAGPALHEVIADWPLTAPIPLLLALPEVEPGTHDVLERDFLVQLGCQARVPLNESLSRVFRQGRAGGLFALRYAMELVGSGRAPLVVVGGVDSYLRPDLLARLDAEGRLHTGPIRDGFIPGEGAAFLLVAAPGAAKRRKREPLARLMGVGIGAESGHRYSAEMCRGEGLAAAFRAAVTEAGPRPRIESIYAGLNGESFWAKEWGVAALRCAEHVAERVEVEHPVQNIGDPGAALGPWMVGLAAIGLRGGDHKGPCLVWCGSDRAERGAAIVHRTLE